VYLLIFIRLQARADVLIANSDGKTALLAATSNAIQNFELAQLLVDQGCSINRADKSGMTPLMHAAFNGHKDIVQLLIDSRCFTRRVDKEGRSALSWANAYGIHVYKFTYV